MSRRALQKADAGRIAAVLALACVAASAAACQRPLPDGESDLADRVTGCWALEATGGDAAADSVSRWLEAGSLPRVVRLDTVPVEGAGDRDLYAAHGYRGDRPDRGVFSAWQPAAGDSLRVQRPGAMAGTVLRLAPDDGALSGTLTVFTDVVQPGETGRTTAAVRARAVECPGGGGGAGTGAG